MRRVLLVHSARAQPTRLFSTRSFLSRSVGTSSNTRSDDIVPLAYTRYDPPTHSKKSSSTSSSTSTAHAHAHAPIFFMHGLFGSQRNNRTMSKLLARDLNRPVYTVDLRNHGDSPHHPEHTYTAMARDVEALISSLAIPPPLLIGHSMGAKVAMTMALRRGGGGGGGSSSNPSSSPSFSYPGLVPVDNAPIDATLQSSFATYVNAMREIAEAPASVVRRQSDADDILAKYEPDVGIRQFLLTNLVKADNNSNNNNNNNNSGNADGDGKAFKWRIPLTTLAKALPGLGDFPFRDPAVARYSGPTLVVRGIKSPYVSDESLPVIGAFFPSFELVDVDCGHWVTSEKPEQFRAAVVDWVKRKVDGDADGE